MFSGNRPPDIVRTLRQTMQRGEEIYRQLREMIVDGELAPGESLSEQVISSRLGASRTPVREAFQRLSREGLLRLVPGRGAFVTEISIPDIVELFQLREALEPFAAGLAARSDDRGRVEPLLTELEGGHDLVKDDPDAYYSLTDRMDRCVVGLTDNARLSRALDETWTQLRRARRVAKTSHDRLHETVDEHKAILAAIRDGDAERAAAVTRQHVRQSLRHIVSSTTVGFAAAFD